VLQLFGGIAWGAGGLLQGFVNAVQFIVQLRELGLFHAQLFLELNFPWEHVLLFATQLFDPGFHLR
jgi:putative IMPACT (imprinted ancient) family translation regulator